MEARTPINIVDDEATQAMNLNESWQDNAVAMRSFYCEVKSSYQLQIFCGANSVYEDSPNQAWSYVLIAWDRAKLVWGQNHQTLKRRHMRSESAKHKNRQLMQDLIPF